ncbi:MAG: ABC transporter ATP-binding protein [Dehalococcoidia bacterium]|nr:ABC transporter ATP-binding protein [Dehalococcoidia bacterium]
MTVAAPGEQATRTGAELCIRGLDVRYGGARGVEALNGLDLDVASGSFHAVLGPSGCGKSTLLRVLAGLLPKAGGSIEGAPADIAYVPQGDSCMPWLTAEDNVAFGLEARGMGKGERRTIARHLLHTLGLDGFARRYPGELSEGMRQRVAIARAFALDTGLLLMDEPLSALDFQTKVHVQDELLGLWEARQPTVLYVTHDIDEALALADRITVLSERPANARLTVEVPFERPRSYRHVRSQPGYAELFGRLLETLEPPG